MVEVASDVMSDGGVWKFQSKGSGAASNGRYKDYYVNILGYVQWITVVVSPLLELQRSFFHGRRLKYSLIQDRS